jgi:periplasmic copper chaperone A
MRRFVKGMAMAGLVLGMAQARAEVTVTEAWVRGTVPAQKATGAFMKLKSSENARLVGAASPAASIVEGHEMAMKDNVMTMRAVDVLELPAGKTVELKPGGYHVMLMALEKPLAEGDSVPITLTFEDVAGKRQAVEIKAPVKALTADPRKH